MYSNAIFNEVLKNKRVCLHVNIAGRIRELREQHGLSNLEFAKRVNVAPSTVYAWEYGNNAPTHKTLEKICNVFNVCISHFERE